jgi:hypothetical protein
MASGATMRFLLKHAAIIAAVTLSAAAGSRACANEPIEIFDAHLHYNWEPKPFYQLDEVLALFKKHRITGILATSRPNTGTHALMDAKAEGLQVVPFIRPYRVRADMGSWFNDPVIFDLVQDEFNAAIIAASASFICPERPPTPRW